MKAPDVLLKPRELRREIERKQLRIETLRRFAEHLTSPLKEVRVKSSPDPTRMQALLAEAADEEKQLPLLEEELDRALTAAALLISGLPDERLVWVLEKRYLDGCDWAETAAVLGYSASQVFKLHRAAIEQFSIRTGDGSSSGSGQGTVPCPDFSSHRLWDIIDTAENKQQPKERIRL